MPDTIAPRKIAILGGGTASLAAAFELTSRPGWAAEHEVTVYQMGWRLGGKGASGRNAEMHQRIQEHGLHVWGGFYENAFGMIRRCYDELGRPPGAPLAAWQDAFKPHNNLLWEEYFDGKWDHWLNEMPANHDLPGGGAVELSIWEYVRMALSYMLAIVEPWAKTSQGEVGSRLPDWLDRLITRAEGLPTPADPSGEGQGFTNWCEHELLKLAHHLAHSQPDDPHDHPATAHRGIIWLLERFSGWFTSRVTHLIELDDAARRSLILFDCMQAAVRGILADGVVFRGFDAIDDHDFAAWLKHNGATDLALGSAVIRGFYDYFFAFEKGDSNRPSMAASIALRHLARLMLTYKGAVFWKMQAGMGDTVFGPLYEVLKRRGVKFEFFHKVEALSLSPDRKAIASIEMAVQARVKDSAEYQPLVEVKGLPCWPDRPHFEQLVEGEAIRSGGYDLESAWSGWADPDHRTLTIGRDFDLVLLGISIAALPKICGDLIEANPAWGLMIEKLHTVQTFGLQIWLTPTAEELGWKGPPGLMTGYAQPLNTWGDFSHLLPREDWPAASAPGNLNYYCGQFPEATVIPPETDLDFPARQRDRFKEMALQWLQDNQAHLYPKGTPGLINPTALDPNLMFDPSGRSGADRMDAQYLRVNVDPTERYVLSPPGSYKYRLPADGSGFSNLILTGDWTRVGLGGCIESAVMTGMMASRAICGSPKTIVGELDVTAPMPEPDESRLEAARINVSWDIHMMDPDTSPHPEAPIPRPRRWRFRIAFSLRTMMFLVLVVGLGMGWQFSRARAVRRAARIIERAGGDVVFDGRRDANGKWIERPRVTAWLCDRLGEEYIINVSRIFFGDNELNSDPGEVIRAIASIPRVKTLGLACYEMCDEDLASISNMSSLEEISVWYMDRPRPLPRPLSSRLPLSPSGIAQLSRLKNLRSIDLMIGFDHPGVIDTHSLQELATLPQLRILRIRDAIIEADLHALDGFGRLRELEVGTDRSFVEGRIYRPLPIASWGELRSLHIRSQWLSRTKSGRLPALKNWRS